jgi:hypothetical protein
MPYTTVGPDAGQPIGVYTTGTPKKKEKIYPPLSLSLTLWPAAAAPFSMKREKDLPWIEYDKAA